MEGGSISAQTVRVRASFGGAKLAGKTGAWCHCAAQQKQEVCLTAREGGGTSSLWRELESVPLKTLAAEASRTKRRQTQAGE